MANKVDKQNFANYLAEAKSWETNKVRALEQSTKVAWWITTAAGMLALISVIGIAVLGPQKTSEPFVIRVDNATGAVDVVSALKNGKTNYEESLNKYFLQWYVRWREGYSKHLIKDYYANVGIMSDTHEQIIYGGLMSKNNPNSPMNLYADGNVTIQIKSTSFINDKVALVRYTKKVDGGSKAGLSHWAATIAFQYVGTPMAESSRAINPLGFQVTEYRNDPDQEITENSLPSKSNSSRDMQPSNEYINSEQSVQVTVPPIQ